MSFSGKRTDKLLSYINSMSEKGLHIDKAQGSCCYFSRDEQVRYVYAVSLRPDGGIYEVLGSEWKYVFTFKGVRFYRKKLPCDLISEKKSFSRSKNPSKAESEWLKAKRADGERLVAYSGGEYIFDDTIDHSGFEEETGEYKSFTVSEELTETENKKLIELTRRGWKFLFATSNGKKYYFFRAESETPGSKGTVTEVAAAFLGATFSLIFMFASLGGILFSVIHSMFIGGHFDPKMILTNGVKPEWLFIVGAIGAFIFGIAYMIFSTVFTKRVEARRRKHSRLSRLKNTSSEPNEPRYNSTQSRETGATLSCDAYQAPTENVAPEFGAFSVKENEYGSNISVTGLIFNILAILVSCAVLTACVIFCYGYFTSGGASSTRWILVPAFLGICFFPFIVYGSAEKCVTFFSARRRK